MPPGRPAQPSGISSAARASLSRTPDSWSASVDTARLILPPAFLEALRAAVPRRRRAKVAHIVAAGVLVVLAVLGADASTREFIAARWHGPSRYARAVGAAQPAQQLIPSAKPSSAFPPVPPADEPVSDRAAAAVASVSESGSAAWPVPAPKKGRARGPKKKPPTEEQ
jgi:hypothetical protein